MRTHRRRAALAWAATALVLGGCSAAGRAPSGPAAPVLRVATSADYPPFSSDREGALTGMDVEIAQRLARDLGMRLELVRIGWPDLTAATQRGDFDIAMSGVTMRADRALVGRFSRPYATVGAVAVIRAADAARFAALAALDRAGVRIAVNAGGHLEQVAHTEFPHAAVIAAPNNRILPPLLAGTVDAVVTDSAELHTWQAPDLRVLGPFSVDHKAYLLPADRNALAAQLDAWIAGREMDGWLDGERVRWLGADARLAPDAAGRESVAALIRLRLDLMPAVAAAKHVAGLPIEDRAQEARVIERVRSRAANPDRVAAVYVQLMEMAKAVERDAPAPDGTVPLSTLRDAIGRVDAALVPAIDSAPASPSAAWQDTLQRIVSGPGVDAAAIRQLADALASDPA